MPTLTMPGEAIFADTSGFLALLDAGDRFHRQTAEIWTAILDSEREIVTTDYVRLESWVLIQRRMGPDAVIAFSDAILPVCRVEIVGEEGFQRASSQWYPAKRRRLSLVDVTSFDCMRRLRIHRALAHDGHFREQGFRIPTEGEVWE